LAHGQVNVAQAIAFHQLIRLGENGYPLHAELIGDSVAYATSKQSAYPGVDVAELAVEVMMVKLALRIVPYLTRYSHIQTNPKYSYSKEKTIDNAKRTRSQLPQDIIMDLVDIHQLTLSPRDRCDFQGS
jgi:hypothetical protein